MVRTSGARGKRYISLEIYSLQQISATFQIYIQRQALFLSRNGNMYLDLILHFPVTINATFLFHKYHLI